MQMTKDILEDLLHIPDLFRRVGWTEADHKRSSEGFRNAWQNQQRQEKRVAEKITKGRLAREALEQEKNNRRALREKAAVDTQAKKSERTTIIELIEKGIDTHVKLVKATGLDGKRTSNHLRYLIAHGKLRKVTPRTYAVVSWRLSGAGLIIH
jgi:hypothetical protein